MFVKKPLDLKTKSHLNTFDSNVELHHIFPKNWVKNNANDSLNNNRLSFPSALIPLSKASNLEWLASSSEQKIAEWHPNHNWQTVAGYFSSVRIDVSSYTPLVNSGTPQARLDQFFNSRKNTLRNTILILTDCKDLPPDLIY